MFREVNFRNFVFTCVAVIFIKPGKYSTRQPVSYGLIHNHQWSLLNNAYCHQLNSDWLVLIIFHYNFRQSTFTLLPEEPDELRCFPTFGGGEREREREVAFRVFRLEERGWDPQPWYLGVRTGGLWLIFLQNYKCQYEQCSNWRLIGLHTTLHTLHQTTFIELSTLNVSPTLSLHHSQTKRNVKL